jgi:hypothetical protein
LTGAQPAGYIVNICLTDDGKFTGSSIMQSHDITIYNKESRLPCLLLGVKSPLDASPKARNHDELKRTLLAFKGTMRQKPIIYSTVHVEN